MYFDAHSDIWCDVTAHRLRGETNVFHNRHLHRLQKGDIEGSIFVIWVDPPYETDYTDRTKQIMDCVRAEIAETKDFRIVHSYDEMMQAKKDGIFYVLIGVEGMSYIGKDLSKIDEYYNFGVRHGMLTWNEANDLGAGASSGEDYGLTDIGKKVVKKMQDKGMLVDTSHLNEAGFWDVASLAIRPLIASHSNASALCGVPRNLTDDQLRAIRDVNGVVGLNSFHMFVDADPRKQTAMRLAEHAAHMIDVMGIDHVCCGFDFFEFLDNDYIMKSMTTKDAPTIAGLEDASKIPNLFKFFGDMGMSKEDQEKIAYKNIQRVIKDAVDS